MTTRELPDRRNVLLAAASLLTLSACSGLIGPSETPVQIFVLSPDLPSVSNSGVPIGQLAIARPEVSASLATNRIALLRSNVFDYYAAAQWTDSTPALLQNLLIEALERNGALGSVARDMAGIHVDHIVQSEIRAFEAHYDHGDGAPTVVVDVMVKVISAAKSEIVGALEFHQESTASANSVPAVVAAFDAALSAILPEIAHWVLELAHRPGRS